MVIHDLLRKRRDELEVDVDGDELAKKETRKKIERCGWFFSLGR